MIPKMDSVLSTFGVPKTINTDNGTPFHGKEFDIYCSSLGKEHRKVTPLWSEANGKVERFTNTLGKVIRTTTADNWQTEVERFLHNYRTTPHRPTSVRQKHFLVDAVKIGCQTCTILTKPTTKKIKDDAEKKRRTKEHNLCIGDYVLLSKGEKVQNKMETFFELKPYQIIDVKDSMITAQSQRRKLTSNCSF